MKSEKSLRGAPLCPAGHLPLKGGDWLLLRLAPFSGLGDWRRPSRHLISPIEGEMAGRPEGGASRKRAS
ncbi:lytic murein transglycosylase [Mesorhizobium sp. WSM4313]|nr:lytic murein transglycosylase [Mesorhizobium sp. WSM4313]